MRFCRRSLVRPDPAGWREVMTTTKIWECKIGEVDSVAGGADYPMRQAVAAAYKAITGAEPVFIFSGWGASLTEYERADVENRPPAPATAPEKTVQEIMEFARHYAANTFISATLEDKIRRSLAAQATDDQLRKDAERYRWLTRTSDTNKFMVCDTDTQILYFGWEADEAIDAAIAKAEGGEA